MKNFERGQDPKKALDIGMDRPKKPGDRFMAWCEEAGKDVEVEAINDEFRRDEWIGAKEDEGIQRRTVDVIIIKGGERTHAISNDWWPGEWKVFGY